MMAARRAVAMASPLGNVPSERSFRTSEVVMKRPAATASRAVACLADTSTMCADPCSSIWERPSGSDEPLARRPSGTALLVDDGDGVHVGHGLHRELKVTER
ncbi:Uncharacterised protein [Mycobacteroides abscessus subsp. abscessus]|nr:Uncharacterised protein [Mycobacteroides abscessus subsp. abscessus]